MFSLIKALDAIPPTLDETYSRILGAISEEERVHVYRFLMWLCFSGRPLRLEELAIIYHVGDSVHPPFQHDQVLFSARGVLYIAQGLLTLSRIETSDSVDDICWRHFDQGTPLNVVHLSHSSVKEYLLSPRAMSWQIREDVSHISIIRSGIAHYLDVADNFSSLRCSSHHELAMKHSLVQYLVSYLPQHLSALDGPAPADLSPSLRLLLDPTTNIKARLGLWIAITEDDQDLSELGDDMPPEMALLLAGQLGLVDIVNWLLHTHHLRCNTMFIYASCGYGPPIVDAAAQGDCNILRVLLDAGADVNKTRGDRVTAIQVATKFNHREVVRVLIDAGADVNKLRGDDGASIQIAAMYNFIEIAHMLLQANANPNACGGSLATAIQEAASRGYIEIVKMLIGAGANLNATKSRGERTTAINLARQNGHQNIVDILVEAGAD
jgi:hypothetical protein